MLLSKMTSEQTVRPGNLGQSHAFGIFVAKIPGLRMARWCTLAWLLLLASSSRADSLLLHYSFDGASVDDAMLAVDSSGNGYDAVMSGAPKGSGDVPVVVAGGTSWHGGGAGGDWMDPVAAPGVLAPTNYTIALWVKPLSHGARTILSARSKEYASKGTALYTRSSTCLRFYHNGEQVITEKESGVVFDTEEWTHIAITVDTVNNTLALYVNGVLRHRKTTNMAPMREAFARIGSSKADLGEVAKDPTDDAYRGHLDDFRIYDYPLTAADIKALAGLPLVHYSFDGSVADPTMLAVDRSANGYDGRINGDPAGSTDVSALLGEGNSWSGKRGDWIDPDVPEIGVLAPTNYTLAFWARPLSPSSTVVVSTRSTDSESQGALYIRSDKGLVFFHNEKPVITAGESGEVFKNGEWTHVAISVDTENDVLALYVNGALRHSGRANMAPLVAGFSRIGWSLPDSGDASAKDSFAGHLDEFYLYNYAMSSEQIQALHGTTSMTFYPPNGDNIPRVLGANAQPALLTGFDYFDWYGITHIRTWYSPKHLSSLPNDISVTTASEFNAATEAVRRDPWRQATANDSYIDWREFERQLVKYGIDHTLENMTARGFEQMLCCKTLASKDTSLTGDWVNAFKHWKLWYSMVYYMASKHDISMYQFGNEPWNNYKAWESHWLVAADAMRKAMEDVNANYGKNLSLNIIGPTTAGSWWDYNYPDPDENTRGWGSVSWEKIKYDLYGNDDVSHPWNYDSYDYHRYSSAPARFEGEILGLRHGMATAVNHSNSEIPILITEMNTNTGARFRSEKNDTESLFYGIGIAQLVQAASRHGDDGLGENGGFFVFKLGNSEWAKPPYSGIENRFNYVSPTPPHNHGGITRGGATFQMFSRHFSGGKAIVPFSVANGHRFEDHRVIAVVDAEKEHYYVYGSNMTGLEATVVYDFSHLDVAPDTRIAVQRVDAGNTGQITELLHLDASRKLVFTAPDLSAYLMTIPKGKAVGAAVVLAPTDDTMQAVVESSGHGEDATMMVSQHHADAIERRVALIRFKVSNVDAMNRVLLKLSGRNVGVDQGEREILHVYAVSDEPWDEITPMTWASAPGVGSYHIDSTAMGTTDGLGDMVEIEDNYSGATSGVGKGLGIHGQFIGAVSFYSSDYQSNYLDVTDYINSVASDSAADVTFVVARIVRYNVNDYDNSHSYNLGDYHYDGRIVEIGSKENADASLHPSLVITSGTVSIKAPTYSAHPAAGYR
jgi:hypothetical protein